MALTSRLANQTYEPGMDPHVTNESKSLFPRSLPWNLKWASGTDEFVA